MYVPPTFKQNDNNELEICDLCDEYLHIDDTPEAKIKEICTNCVCCIRKSVTCVCIVKNKTHEIIYSKVYKNKIMESSQLARHAEMFFISDVKLREILDFNQVITLYLTYQPCHYSGGHYKPSTNSCTEALCHFNEKILKYYDIKLKIRFAYLYRAHWVMSNCKYSSMIQNANDGLKILLNTFDVDVMRSEDIAEIQQHLSSNMKKKLSSGFFDKILEARIDLEEFISRYLSNIL